METSNVMRELRALIPHHTLTLSEAFSVAELQATMLLGALKIDGPSVDVARIAELPKIDVQLQPRHRMPTLAGFSQWVDGRWLIVVNRDGPAGRRRFTLAHEFKHVLDHPHYKTAYRQLGRGDKQQHDRQIELVCNYFAACVLMPCTWLKRAYASGIQDEEALAGLFKVSMEAMHTRLIYLGYINDDRRPLADYFRSNVDVPEETTLAA